jgi:hypothetical protein
MMTIQALVHKLETTRKQAENIIRNPDSSTAHRRMANKQLAKIDNQLATLRKAMPKTA